MKNLIFVPGIMGSGLRDAQGSVWPPTVWEVISGYGKLSRLLNPNLTPTDPVQQIGPVGVYKSLLDDITACGYSQGNLNKRFIPFPYDWRQSNATTAGRLVQFLDQEYTDPSQDLEITLLGHSMGGLVLRYLLESGKYSDRPWFEKITRLVTMGTPHFGASLALYRLTGSDSSAGLSGAQLKKLANVPGFSAAYELVPPAHTALTAERPQAGDLPASMDPFDPEIVARLGMETTNIAKAREFWAKLDLAKRPNFVDYFFVVGSAIKTNVRSEWINANHDPLPIERKSTGDGTVPIASALVVGIPHVFSQKKHMTIFTDRRVRRYLYRILDAPANVLPQSADTAVALGAPDALGISVNKEVYEQGEEIEVVVSYSEERVDPREIFELTAIDPDTGQRVTDGEPIYINVSLRGVSVGEFSFSISDELSPGVYELSSQREVDDPERTVFYVRGRTDGD